MRKNTARHWLHAGLDLLPLILIPVFMIYSHRHTIDSGSIEVPQNQVVDFNQLINDNQDDYDGSGITITNNNDGSYTINGISTSHYYYALTPVEDNRINHVFYMGFKNLTTAVEGLYFREPYSFVQTGTTRLYTNQLNDYYFSIFVGNGYTFNNVVVYPQWFDLTQMFGVGNEPTLEKFEQWYSNVYYPYTLSHKELLKDITTISFSDTDIMSQAVYQLYNSVDKYFNMGNVFNMGAVYDWFNLNIFNGNAPISIYIVWNIVLYEFVMDLLFLLYALFMWFIDMTKRLIEKPLDSIK